jgi:cell division protein FtsB
VTTTATTAGPPGPSMTEPGARPFRSVLVAVVAFLVLLLATFALRGWQDVSRSRSRAAALEAEVAATEARIAELKRRIDRLRDDPVTLDRMAREEVGLVAPGDVVIVLPSAPTPN